MCNQNKADIDREFSGTNVELKLYISDSVLTDIDGLITAGGGAASIYALLAEKGVISGGLLAGTAAPFIGGIILVYWGWITVENDGCGVTIETNFNPATPISPVTATPIVKSQ
jgi:hypothetical protein